MIDPATSWFEIRPLKDSKSETAAKELENCWLTRYPWPTTMITDRGSEFKKDFIRMVENDYGITRRPISTRNPQANAVLERIHQTIGNMIRTFQPQLSQEENPWDTILSAVRFAVHSTYHTTLQATPTQLVFGRDAIMNTKFEANWNYIRQRKQQIIHKNNQRENSKRKEHHYQIGDQVLFAAERRIKFGINPYEGPYEIVQVNENGTVRIRKGAVTDTVNIRLIKPYNA